MAGVLISGLAGFWLFVAITTPGSPLTPVRRALERLPRGEKLTACPFCLGAWLSFAVYGAVWSAVDPTTVAGGIAQALASAGVCGILGALTAE